jgi:hypothetical protein
MKYGKWQVFTEIEPSYSCFNCKCTATTTASFCLKTLQRVRTEKSIVLGMRALHEAEAAKCGPTQIPRTTQSELLTQCKELVDFFLYKRECSDSFERERGALHIRFLIWRNQNQNLTSKSFNCLRKVFMWHHAILC